MRIYPELPGPRTKQALADLSVAALLVGCALLGWVVHSAVLTLRIISDGLSSLSDGIQGTWSSAADIFSAIPLVGQNLSSLLTGLADGTVGNAGDLARSISSAITLTANVLGVVTFLIPLALVAVLWLPGRIRRAQRWHAAASVLGLGVPRPVGPGGPLPLSAELAGLPAEQATAVIALAPPAHLLAMRALCVMPFEDLVKFEPRPFEAYAEGRHDGLVSALYAYEGLRRVG